MLVLPEDCVHIVWYSFPKRAYLARIAILDFSLAVVVPEVKFPFKEIRKSIAPQKRCVYIRGYPAPGCQAARISDVNLVKLFIVSPVAVAIEEERVAIQVSMVGESIMECYLKHVESKGIRNERGLNAPISIPFTPAFSRPFVSFPSRNLALFIEKFYSIYQPAF